MFIHNLLNELVQIANKWDYKKLLGFNVLMSLSVGMYPAKQSTRYPFSIPALLGNINKVP
jgi:hypothetical protein